MEKIYDIIIWGASGFTGRLAVDYIYKNQNNSNLTWAVAGRNESKIKEIIDKFKKHLRLLNSSICWFELLNI